MLLVRVAARAEDRAEVVRIADTTGAKIVDQTADTYVLEISGEESKIALVLGLLRPFGIHEVVRTGKIAIARGVTLRQATGSQGGRKHRRHSVGFEVRVPAMGSELRVRAHDISMGGMRLKTNSEIAVGTQIAMNIVHPTTGEQFPLTAVVRHRIDRPDFRGIGVEFVEIDETQRSRLDEFMSGEAAETAEVE
jgi:hypothetical protein